MYFQYVLIDMSQGEDIFLCLPSFWMKRIKSVYAALFPSVVPTNGALTFTLSLNLDRFLIGVFETFAQGSHGGMFV